MQEKKYGWKGWKMPILHPNDPDFCEIGCPICLAARKGNKVAKVRGEHRDGRHFRWLLVGLGQETQIRRHSRPTGASEVNR